MKKRILGLLMALVMVLGVYPINVSAASDVYKETGDYLENQAKQSAPTVNSIGGEWVVIGLARSGRSVPAGYYDNAVQFVENNINDKSQLHRNKSTENSRVILALTAAGYDVTNVAGYNLLEGLTSMTYLKKQGINGPIWALIAYDSHDYAIPSGDGTVTRDTLIDTILAAQITDGGWNLDPDATISDPDMTGMALQALAPYYNSDSEVKTAVNEALTCLSDAQNSDGGYSSSGDANSESVVQVIVALTALGINPDSDSRFIKNGNSVLDSLYTYAVEGGGFEHIKGEGLNQMATEQGYYALTAYERFKEGKSSLYDMTDVKLPADIEAEEAKKEADKKAAAEVDKKIEAIGTVTLDSESKINEARNAYNGLTADQKSYVTKLGTLEAAETKLAELKKAAAEEEEKQQQIAKDKAAAAEVDKKIEAIGTVTLDSESKITEARSAYNGLTADQKGYVTKLATLEDAEDRLAELKEEANKPDEPDEPVQPDTPEVELPFTDVEENSWYYDSVEYVYVNKLMKGVTDTTFAPKQTLTRAMFATILYRANGEPKVKYENTFSDVAEGKWYTNGIIWASEAGIVKGYGNGVFGINDSITREQMAVMMYRYADYMKYDIRKNKDISSYSDAGEVSAYAVDAMKWAVGNGIIEGKSSSVLDPRGQANRAECATIITRFEKLYQK